ncbi:MAG TPA: ATPase inhibitor subunit zeta [Rhodopila sp.]|jgi:hypothetical protein|nr:ATPase inhibitor subunit zeta [Rhodopila sp.]
MATEMREREQGFEAKFAHDEQMRFMIRARRDKLFARWAAAILKLSPEQTDALVQTVIHIPDGPKHDQTLLDTVAERLAGETTREAQSAALARCLAEAQAALDRSVTFTE